MSTSKTIPSTPPPSSSTSASPSSVIFPSHPLNLHMSTVTHAVEDIITGYEHLVHKLPNLSEKIKVAHKETEGLVTDLQKRTEHLLADYEYVNDLTSQIPSLLGKSAENYKNNLLSIQNSSSNSSLLPSSEATRSKSAYLQFTTEEEEKERKEIEKSLEEMKKDLQSLSYQKNVIEVLTRPTFNSYKNDVKSSASTTGIPGSSSNLQNIRKRLEEEEEKEKRFEELDQPIVIPEYNSSNILDQYKNKKKKKFTSAYTTPSLTSSNVARKVHKDAVVVPSMSSNHMITKNINLSPSTTSSSSNIKKKKKEKETEVKKLKTSSLPTNSLPRSIPSTSSSSIPSNFPTSLPPSNLPPSRSTLADKEIRKIIEDKLTKERIISEKKIDFLYAIYEKKQENSDKIILNMIDNIVEDVVSSFSNVIEDLDILKYMDEIIEKILPRYDLMAAAHAPPSQINEGASKKHIESHHYHHHLCLPNEEMLKNYSISSNPPTSEFPTTTDIPSTSHDVSLVDHSLQVDIVPEVTSQEQQTEPIEIVEEVEEEEIIPPPPSTPPPPPTQIININHPPLEQSLLQVITQVVQSQQGQQALLLSLINSLNERKSREEEEREEEPEEENEKEEVLEEKKVVLVNEIGIQTETIEEEKKIVEERKIEEEKKIEEERKIEEEKKIEEIVEEKIEEEEEDSSKFRSNFATGFFRKKKKGEEEKTINVNEPVPYLEQDKNPFSKHNKFASDLTSVYLKEYFKKSKEEGKQIEEVEKIKLRHSDIEKKEEKEREDNILLKVIDKMIAMNEKKEENQGIITNNKKNEEKIQVLIENTVTNCVREALGYILPSPSVEESDEFYYDKKNNLVYNMKHLKDKENLEELSRREKQRRRKEFEEDNEENIIKINKINNIMKTKGDYKVFGRDINQYDGYYQEKIYLRGEENEGEVEEYDEREEERKQMGKDREQLQKESKLLSLNLFDIDVIDNNELKLTQIEKEIEKSKKNIEKFHKDENKFDINSLINEKTDLSFNDSISLDEDYMAEFDFIKYEDDEDRKERRKGIELEEDESEIFHEDQRYIKKYEEKLQKKEIKKEKELEKIKKKEREINSTAFVPLCSNVLELPLTKEYNQKKFSLPIPSSPSSSLSSSPSSTSLSTNSSISNLISPSSSLHSPPFVTSRIKSNKRKYEFERNRSEPIVSISSPSSSTTSPLSPSLNSSLSTSYSRPKSKIEREKRKQILTGVNSRISTDEIDINQLRSKKFQSSIFTSSTSPLLSSSPSSSPSPSSSYYSYDIYLKNKEKERINKLNQNYRNRASSFTSDSEFESESNSESNSSVSSYRSFTVLNPDDVSLLNSLDDSIYKSKSNTRYNKEEEKEERKYRKSSDDEEDSSISSSISSSSSSSSSSYLPKNLVRNRGYGNPRDEDSDSIASLDSSDALSISSSNDLVHLNFNIPIIGLKK